MDDLTREFLIESQEGLDRMERCLTELEQSPQDAMLLAEIFRSVHTIKGATGFLGFGRLEKLAHSGENLLGALRDGKLPADARIITVLLKLLDALRGILKAIETEAGEGAGDDSKLIAQLDRLQAPALAAARQPAHALAGARRKHKAQPVPSAPAPDSAAASASEPSPPPVAFSSAAGQALPAQADAAPPHTPSQGTAESTLRVDVALLNRMMNLVGELVLARNQVLQATAADARMTALSRRLDMVTADLREAVMKARLQPVSYIFSKIPRAVRDLSQELGRRVRLEMEGQETELDKSLLEAVKDPLTHAVRNALDHGIEPPAEREAAGKNPEGTLRLRALQEGSYVLIEVTDDGAGIAVEKVRSRAIERGLLTPDRAALLSERELLRLLFLPGFSTAASVTRVSGRGVGMDVVHTNVERIGGKVEIESRPGHGTTLRLRIPLTLAIVPALIVRSLDQSFALPQAALSELVHIPHGQAATAIRWMQNAPLYRLRGKLLPLVFLDRLLAPGCAPAPASDRDRFIAVLNADGRRFGLVVDGLADPEEIVVKPLSPVLKGIGLYSGATVLGNADLALILDPGSIALKAGLALGAEEDAAPADEDAGSAAKLEYLLVETSGRRAAVPLDEVLRIEQLPLSRIEIVGRRPVLNLGSQLLPLVDSGGILSSAPAGSHAPVIVVVCRKGNRQIGMVVSQVLDAAAGGRLSLAGAGIPAGGITLLDERVTAVVGFGSVPALAFTGEASLDWNPVAEVLP